MKIFLKALNRIYQFFAGDVLLLGFVALAFGSAALLQNQSQLMQALLLVGLMVTGLIASLWRESLSNKNSVRK
ncbi:hypothetical protein HY229_09320 [Candidatus Acetothermia bacterium]|nr:hypothetical protein [Candidatus Acetothermia bacterium]MBI3644282.1 hypothetical protein [Candidatus Acetothermia bacterium]